MQAPGGWVPKEVGYGDPRVRTLAVDLSHLLPLYALSFPVALKRLLDLSGPFLQLLPSCPHPSSEGTTSALPTAGGASQPHLQGEPWACSWGCAHPRAETEPQSGKGRGKLLGACPFYRSGNGALENARGLLPVHCTPVGLEDLGQAARLLPHAVNTGFEGQFCTRHHARCWRLTSDKPVMGPV